MRILFIRLRSLGDTVLLTPALAAAKGSGAEVGVVIEEPFAPILRNHPSVDRLFTVRRRGWPARLHLLLSLRRYAADITIDTHGGSTSGLLTAFSGASRTVGYQVARHSRLFDVRVPDPREIWGRQPLHTVEYLLAPLRYLEIKVEPVPPAYVPVQPESIRKIQSELHSRGVPKGFILVHPAAAFETKQWPTDRFAALIRALQSSRRHFVVTAGPGQGGLADEVVRHSDSDSVTVIPPLDLESFAALASLSGSYIGNDTGTTHIAAALGKPVLVVFGSSNPAAWHPWGTRFKLLRSNRACIPCPGYHCLHYPHARCIRDIEVESAVQAFRELV